MVESRAAVVEFLEPLMQKDVDLLRNLKVGQCDVDKNCTDFGLVERKKHQRMEAVTNFSERTQTVHKLS